MTDLIEYEFDEITGPVELPDGAESTLRERAICKHNYGVYSDRLENAKTVPQMLDALGVIYEPMEGKNTWTESAIKDTFGIEVIPELQEFYSLGISFVSDFCALDSFEDVMRLNHSFRYDRGFTELYMPFDHHFIFGGNGGGDFFMLAYTKHNQLLTFPIYEWNHETDSRSTYSYGGFKEFLARYQSGFGCAHSWPLY